MLEALRERGWALGGEQSGHIIDTGFVPSGDGIAAALLTLEALGGGDLAERHAMEKLPQRLVNVRVRDRGALDAARRRRRGGGRARGGGARGPRPRAGAPERHRAARARDGRGADRATRPTRCARGSSRGRAELELDERSPGCSEPPRARSARIASEGAVMCGIVGYVGHAPGPGAPARRAREARVPRLRLRGHLGAQPTARSTPCAPSATSARCATAVDASRRGATAASRSPAPPATTGIGHTRWATHGRVTEENAHPHYDTDDRVHVVVNGIVENYMELKQRAARPTAPCFTSETDAEVIAHLIAPTSTSDDLVEAVRARLRPSCAATTPSSAIAADEPGVLVGARKECPLVVGRGDGEQFIASAHPRLPRAHAHACSCIEDDEIVVVRRRRRRVPRPPTASRSSATIDEVDWDEEAAEKGGYETFMLKEIHEQADAVAETIADRTVRADGVDLGGSARSTTSCCASCKRIVIVACGTSYHAGLIGRYAIEEWARVPVEMDIASEYRYRNPVVGPGDLVIGITQSGETADTLAAMRLARERGAKVLAVTNIMGSQATRDADGVLFTRAGLEIGVAATKTFVAQVAVDVPARAAARRAARHARAERRARAGRRAQAHPARHRRDARERADRRDRPHRRAPLRRGVLPLPRPPRRPAGVPRGRAQAQGDLLHRRPTPTRPAR